MGPHSGVEWSVLIRKKTKILNFENAWYISGWILPEKFFIHYTSSRVSSILSISVRLFRKYPGLKNSLFYFGVKWCHLISDLIFIRKISSEGKLKTNHIRSERPTTFLLVDCSLKNSHIHDRSFVYSCNSCNGRNCFVTVFNSSSNLERNLYLFFSYSYNLEVFFRCSNDNYNYRVFFRGYESLEKILFFQNAENSFLTSCHAWPFIQISMKIVKKIKWQPSVL